ncbi:MAG: SNF2-related protein, partial [Verrucomicrobiota bacterium]
MELTRPWLQKIAGWKAVKQATLLFNAGAVVEADRKGDVVKGIVVAGKRRQVAGFKINDEFDVDNLCTCIVARRTGQVCEHSVAVVLALISDPPEEPKPKTEPKPAAAPKPAPPAEPVEVCFDERAFELWAKGRIPIQFRKRDGDPNDADVRISAWLNSVGVQQLPTRAVLKPAQAAQLIVLLRGAEQVSVGERALTVSDVPAARLRVELSRDGDEFALSPFAWAKDDQELLDGFVWFPERGLIQSLRKPPKGADEVYRDLLNGDAARIPAADFIRNAAAWEEAVEFVGQTLHIAQAQPRFHLALEGSLNALSGVATVHYPDDVAFRMGQGRDDDFPIESGDQFLNRNPAAEDRAQQLLENAGFTGPDAGGQFQLRGKAEIARFVASSLPDLRENWNVELGERFQYVLRNVEVIRPQLETIGTDNQWLSFSINYTSDGGSEIPRADIQKLLAKSQNQTQLPNGKTAFVDLGACEEANEVIFDVDPRQEGDVLRAAAHHAGYLNVALGGKLDFDEENVDLAQLGDLSDLLRDYQSTGIRWLTSRLRSGANACLLADEMGLGKTLQSLAAAELALQDAGGGQVLVVCPTSLLANWFNEAAKFLPDRAVHVLHGPKRWNKIEDFEYAEIIITSYALLT